MCKRKIFILYTTYFDCMNCRNLTGGIQTYITHLISIFIRMDLDVNVIQCGNENFVKEFYWGKLHVIKNLKFKNNILFRYVKKIADELNDIILFADDALITPNNFKYSIGIQHGIAWDKPYHQSFPRWLSEFWVFKKSLLALKKIRLLNYVKYEICVDNNFINWYRALVAYPTVKLWYIPNFTNVPQNFEHYTNYQVQLQPQIIICIKLDFCVFLCVMIKKEEKYETT